VSRQQQLIHAASLLGALLLGYLLANMSQTDTGLQASSYDSELADLKNQQARILAAIESIQLAHTSHSNSAEIDGQDTQARRIADHPEKEINLNQLIEQIDELRRELDTSLEAFKKESVQTPTAMLRRSAQSAIPRNDVAIEEVLNMLGNPESFGTTYSEIQRTHMMSMDQALQRFGRPDEIVPHSGSHVYWGYEKREFDKRVWKLDLIFQQGILSNISD